MYSRMEYGLMKRKMPNGKTVYYYWVYDANGKRVYRSTGQKTKSKALDYVLERREEGNLGKLDKWGETLKDFTENMFVPGKCPIEKEETARGKTVAGNTMKNRRISLTKHIIPYLGNVRVNALTSAQVNDWLVNLPEKDKISRTTSNQCLDALSKVMAYAVKIGAVQNNPCKGVEPLGNDSEAHSAFTIPEIKLVVGNESDWKNPLIRLMCLTSAMTGMRLGEVLALMPCNVHETHIDVRYSLSPTDGIKTPKSGKGRMVPINGMLYRELMHWSPPQSGKFIFSMDGVTPFSPSSVAVALKNRCTKVGITGKTFHGFRAFFNSIMVTNKVSESIVRRVIGHSNVDMTEHYLHMEAGDLTMITDVQDSVGAQIIDNQRE